MSTKRISVEDLRREDACAGQVEIFAGVPADRGCAMSIDMLTWATDRGACQPALDWLATLDDRSPEAVYAACPRGDWLLWWHAKAGTPAGAMQPVAQRCAERARGYATAADAAAAAAARWAAAGAVAADAAEHATCAADVRATLPVPTIGGGE